MTMANLQKLNPTQQELYNYLEQQTGQVNFEVLQPFTTQEMGAVLHISRNTVSQYLNEFFKEGWMVKINTRPVYYFLRETLSRKFNVQTLDSEYEDLQFLQQDLNHGRRADSIMPKVLSLLTTLGVYRLLKKGTKPNTILLGIIVVSVLLTAIGIF